MTDRDKLACELYKIKEAIRGLEAFLDASHRYRLNQMYKIKEAIRGLEAHHEAKAGPAPQPGDQPEFARRLRVGPGVVMPDPGREDAFAIVIYLPSEDRFRVYRGAVQESIDHPITNP